MHAIKLTENRFTVVPQDMIPTTYSGQARFLAVIADQRGLDVDDLTLDDMVTFHRQTTRTPMSLKTTLAYEAMLADAKVPGLVAFPYPTRGLLRAA